LSSKNGRLRKLYDEHRKGAGACAVDCPHCSDFDDELKFLLVELHHNQKKTTTRSNKRESRKIKNANCSNFSAFENEEAWWKVRLALVEERSNES